MTTTEQRITRQLLKVGPEQLAKLWNCSTAEASRRLDNDRGVRLSDWAKALDAAGIQVLAPDETPVPTERYRALLLLSRERMEMDPLAVKGSK